MVHLPLIVQIIVTVGVAFSSTLAITPAARWFSRRYGVVDAPDGGRKTQRQPVALLGGVAVLAGLAVTVVAASLFGTLADSAESIALVCGGLSLLCAYGVCDDLWNLHAGWKLLAQFAASIPIVMAGCAITQVNLFGTVTPLGNVGFVAAILWLVACTNAVNLIDGMDGLCSTVALCIAAGIVAIGYWTGAHHTLVCAAALAGSLAAFLIYNAPPATIYLGDAGSMVVGMTLALLTLRVSQNAAGVSSPLVMVALMAVPLGDVLLAVLRRKLNGKAIWQADRGHIHHRLLDQGLSIPKSLAVVGAVCLTTAAIGVGIQVSGSNAFGCLALGFVGAVLVNRRVVGHFEWSMVRSLVSRSEANSSSVPHAPLPEFVRFDEGHLPMLRLHIPDTVDEELVETRPLPLRRRAA